MVGRRRLGIYVAGFDEVPTDPNERRQLLGRLQNKLGLAENATVNWGRQTAEARAAYLQALSQLTRCENHERECRQALDYYLEDVDREYPEDAQAMVAEA